MDPASNLPIAGPRVSAFDGLCNFGTFKAGGWKLLVFGGVEYRAHDVSGFQSKDMAAGDGFGPAFLTGPDKTPPVRIFQVQVRKVAPDSLPRISGVVVDAETGVPLDRVFVSLSPNLTGYQGQTLPSDDVTLADGAFSVAQIPFGLDPMTGNLHQINPLRLTRSGYRPLVWSYDPPNGSNNVDIRGVLLGMEKLSGSDIGSISGRLLRSNVPVSGVAVGLGVLNVSEGEKAAAGMPGWTSVTDLEGRFKIDRLPAGTYILQPGYPLADDAFFPDQPNNRPYTVEARQQVTAEDLEIWHEIVPWTPPHGIWLGAAPDSLTWSPVPGAATYEVRLNGGVLPKTTTNSAPIPPTMDLAPGLHYWTVVAFAKSGAPVAATQIQYSFRIKPGS